MAGTIKINNPIVGGIIVIVLLFIIWFIFGPVGGIFGQSIIQYAWASVFSVLVLYKYYISFWGKK